MLTHDQLLTENAVLRKRVRELTALLQRVNDEIEPRITAFEKWAEQEPEEVQS
jgi:hypothetical protein